MGKPEYNNLTLRKFRLLKVKHILESETDTSHSITMGQLIDKLNADVEPDRRVLYDDIRDMAELGTIVKIDKSKTPPQLSVRERLFTLSELKLMIDAITSSKFLTKKASDELIDKLKLFCSRYEATELNRQTLITNRAKRVDNDFHNYVSLISKAIQNDKKISFQYFRIGMNNTKKYNKNRSIVSPWFMIYVNDRYYLLAFDGKEIRQYRVDRMESVMILLEAREGADEAETIKKELPFRTQSAFNVFGGEKEQVTLRCPTHFYFVIADQFGASLYPIVDKKTDTFTVTVPVVLGDAFFGWVLSMRNKVTIVDPPRVKKMMKEILSDVGREYR